MRLAAAATAAARHASTTNGCRGPTRAPVGPGVVPPASAGVELRDDTLGFVSCRTRLTLREAALLDAEIQLGVVLQLPTAVRVDDDVELEVLRVEAVRGAPERLLEVDVPACELASGSVPEHPDCVRLARALERERAVPLPRRADALPRMRERRGRVGDRCSLGEVGDEDVVVVLDHAYRELRPAVAAVQHLAVLDDVALRPHASPSAGRAASIPPAAATPPSPSATGPRRSRARPRRAPRRPVAR